MLTSGQHLANGTHGAGQPVAGFANWRWRAGPGRAGGSGHTVTLPLPGSIGISGVPGRSGDPVVGRSAWKRLNQRTPPSSGGFPRWRPPVAKPSAGPASALALDGASAMPALRLGARHRRQGLLRQHRLGPAPQGGSYQYGLLVGAALHRALAEGPRRRYTIRMRSRCSRPGWTPPCHPTPVRPAFSRRSGAAKRSAATAIPFPVPGSWACAGWAPSCGRSRR